MLTPIRKSKKNHNRQICLESRVYLRLTHHLGGQLWALPGQVQAGGPGQRQPRPRATGSQHFRPGQ